MSRSAVWNFSGLRSLTLLLTCGAAVAIAAGDDNAAKKHNFARWEKSIAAFEKQDAASAPPQGGCLFVGSSSIRLWPLKESFPEAPVINRGFGGSQIIDSVHFCEQLVLKHKPHTVLLYAGDNDVAAGKDAKRVHADFRKFVATVHETLPETRIGFIAIKPSIRRWNLADTMQAANRLIASDCAKEERLFYVDVWQPMLGEDGKPRPELFAKDGLHLNRTGYALWNKLVQPHVEAVKQ